MSYYTLAETLAEEFEELAKVELKRRMAENDLAVVELQRKLDAAEETISHLYTRIATLDKALQESRNRERAKSAAYINYVKRQTPEERKAANLQDTIALIKELGKDIP